MNNNSVNDSIPCNETKFVKLPKLNVEKFYGECTQFTNFWNAFNVSINDNNSLMKTEKYNFFQSYLGLFALNTIEGLEISESNYNIALKIFKNRFVNKEMIINHHINKLLNLSSVYKSNDVSKLQKLHYDIEINVAKEENKYPFQVLHLMLNFYA